MNEIIVIAATENPIIINAPGELIVVGVAKTPGLESPENISTTIVIADGSQQPLMVAGKAIAVEIFPEKVAIAVGGSGSSGSASSSEMLSLVAQSVDPADPAEGGSTLWHSDGTESGDEGDHLIKVNVGGHVIIATFLDYSDYLQVAFILQNGDDVFITQGGDVFIPQLGGTVDINPTHFIAE